jgi:Tol biopolymer transport system component
MGNWPPRDGNHELYQMNTDGSNRSRLTDNPSRERYPAGSR